MYPISNHSFLPLFKRNRLLLKAWGAILRGAAKLQNPTDIFIMPMGFLTFIGYLFKMGRYCQQVYRSLIF